MTGLICVKKLCNPLDAYLTEYLKEKERCDTKLTARL